MTSGRGTPGQAEIRVRPMLESDIEAVARIGSLSSQTPWTEVSVLTYFLREDTIFAVAEEGENGPLIGFAALLLAPPESDVLDIVVETACRGRGVGYALLDGICDLALIKGVDTGRPTRRREGCTTSWALRRSASGRDTTPIRGRTRCPWCAGDTSYRFTGNKRRGSF